MESFSAAQRLNELENKVEEELVEHKHFIEAPPDSSNEKAKNKTTEPETENEKKTKRKTKTKDDLSNIILLIVIYIMQGIPNGLSSSIPLILASRRVSYSDLGTFSFATWPLSLKILWAPIVDSIYVKKFGRRKSWLVPIQLMIGLVTISSADYLKNILEANKEPNSSDITMLTLIFGILLILVSTHDIVVDGWAIELLLKENVSWQGTCNSTGFVCGIFIGNSLFLLLESAKFCNSYIRPLFKLEPQNYGVANIGIFFYVYGILILLMAILIMIFKSEINKKKLELESENNDDEEQHAQNSNHSITHTYKSILRLFFSSNIRKLIAVLITIRIGFATEFIIRIRLIEEGVQKEIISMLGILLSPLTVFLPLLLNRFIHGPYPFSIIIKTYGLKLIIVMLYSIFVFVTPFFRNFADKSFPFYYYGMFFVLNIISASCNYIFFVSIGSFFAKISDKSIGGTYMTFLAMWLGVGLALSRTSVLYLTSFFTFKKCHFDSVTSLLNSNSTNIRRYVDLVELVKNLKDNSCSTTEKTKHCVDSGAECLTQFDGFYFLTLVLILFGFIWLVKCRKVLVNLQSKPYSVWLISNIKMHRLNCLKRIRKKTTGFSSSKNIASANTFY